MVERAASTKDLRCSIYISLKLALLPCSLVAWIVSLKSLSLYQLQHSSVSFRLRFKSALVPTGLIYKLPARPLLL